VHGGRGSIDHGLIDIPGRVDENLNGDNQQPAARAARPEQPRPCTCDTCGTADGMVGGMTRCPLCIALDEPVPARQGQGAAGTNRNTGGRWRCRHCGVSSTRQFATKAASDADYYRTHMPCPVAGDLDPASENLFWFTCLRCGFDSGAIYPDLAACRAADTEHTCATPDREGDDMNTTATQAGGSATGDAHDLESASNECDLLLSDLTAIDTALDLIDERIGSAGTAAEGIAGFLGKKNMPDSTTTGMATALEMLSPDRIKALMDAVAAAKQGVQNSKDAIDTMNEQATEALQGADGSAVNGR
jgi:hypothetical protein